MLFELLASFAEGMRAFRQAVEDNSPPGQSHAVGVPVLCLASELPTAEALATLPKRPTLVVTSTPYPGVYVHGGSNTCGCSTWNWRLWAEAAFARLAQA
jgi:hypothetical protein